MKVKTNFNSCVIVQANEIDNKGTWTVLLDMYYSQLRIKLYMTASLWSGSKSKLYLNMIFFSWCSVYKYLLTKGS